MTSGLYEQPPPVGDDAPGTVTEVIDRVHREILNRAGSAGVPQGGPDPHRSLELYDAELEALSRDLATVEAVLYPAARRHLPRGNAVVSSQLRRARRIERAMRLLENRLYGEVHAQDLSARDLQKDLSDILVDHLRAERELATRLDEVLDLASRERLAHTVARALRHAPTRPHPYVPHIRGLARLVFRVCSSVDAAMDVMDARILPSREPARRRRTRHPLLDSYVLGSPSFEVAAEGRAGEIPVQDRAPD